MKISVPITAILLSALILGCHKKSSNDDNTLSFDEIKNKIESAKDSDTVNIPEGTCIFETHIIINKNITLKGAGVDKTIFYNDQKNDYESVLEIRNNDKPIRITGITFKGQGQDTSESNKSQFIRWVNTAQAAQITGFRIDHCKFMDGGKYSINILGKDDIFGVIDHCTFINSSNECICVFGAGTGDLDWSRAEPLGTSHAVFVEDCSFTYNKPNTTSNAFVAIVADNGSRYVFRYNTINTLEQVRSAQIDMHGNYFVDRGGYSAEIYNNTLYSKHSWGGTYMRGGRGVILNNTFTGEYYNPIVFTNDGSYLPSKSDPRDKTYPAIDQVNNFYVKNNTLNGTAISDGIPGDYVFDRGLDRTHIQNNRDYFDANSGGYVPYAYPHPLTQE